MKSSLKMRKVYGASGRAVTPVRDTRPSRAGPADHPFCPSNNVTAFHCDWTAAPAAAPLRRSTRVHVLLRCCAPACRSPLRWAAALLPPPLFFPAPLSAGPAGNFQPLILTPLLPPSHLVATSETLNYLLPPALTAIDL